MRKKPYISPEMCIIETDSQVLLSGSVVHSCDGVYDIEYGDIDEDGEYIPG